MHLTAASNGALRILTACSARSSMTMSEMSKTLGLAGPLVVKICHQLMQAGYLVGQRGRNGGYRLAIPAQHIGALEIIDLFEGRRGLFPCCPTAAGACRIIDVCRLRAACERAHTAFRAELDYLTLRDLAPDDIPA
jgi:Rrf2 family transcriptional regulator, nitric oxide-sensitive transcriptional repressor